MTSVRMKIIMWAEYIARNYTGVQSTMLIVVTSISNIYESLGITVTIIRRMWRSIVNLENR